MRGSRRLAALCVVLAASGPAGCTKARNYTDLNSPRYEGHHAVPDVDPVLKLVTYNIKFSIDIDGAIALFQKNHALQNADIVTLQEMEAPGVERIAASLGYDYVYYPTAWHPKGKHDFGEAILVRGRILEDHKIVLPHLAHFTHLQRIAVEATVLVDGQRIHVYSVHLGTPVEVWPSQKRDQVRAIVADAASQDGMVLIAGDMNCRAIVGDEMVNHGFDWITRNESHTLRLFSWDQVFVRGLRPASAEKFTGVVLDAGSVSDHFPVWALLAPLEARASVQPVPPATP